MNRRVALFALGLGAVFAASFALGSAFDRADTDPAGAHGTAAHGGAGHEEEAASADGHGGHAEASTAAAGLGLSEDGYSLRLDSARFEPGAAGQLRFRIEAAGGATVLDFDRAHERDLHLIVVRRDGAHFQHLHPRMDAAGNWTTALELPAAGVYRAFADFAVDGASHTLATDLFAPGEFDPRAFPASTNTDAVDGYELRLTGDTPRAGRPAALRFAVSREGEPVADLEDYLGARGHLVALREGDLAFLHVHPDAGAAPGVIAYTAHFPTAGRYRLFLQFKHGGRVRTAEFTLAVAR
jgi:hypothetical protein